MTKPDRREFGAVVWKADVDFRTGQRYWREPERLSARSRERIERAIMDLGLSHLLARPFDDAEAAEDLRRCER
jgi:hypothetical protein